MTHWDRHHPVPTLIPYGGTIVTNTSAPRPGSGGVGSIFGDVNFVPEEAPEEGPGELTGGEGLQNPPTTPQDNRSSNQKACDDKIAGIFGGPGAVAATVAEPTTLLSDN
jgi:hypothetical protein